MACVLALLALFVFASAVSAAVLWVARVRVLAMGAPAHFYVLTSSRYAAIAAVAYVIFLYILQRSRRTHRAAGVALAMFCLLAAGGLSTAMTFDPYLHGRDGLESAATALLMGTPPVDDEGWHYLARREERSVLVDRVAQGDPQLFAGRWILVCKHIDCLLWASFRPGLR